jgi:hypothetical protein
MPVQPSLPEAQPPSSSSFEKASLPTTYSNVFRASGSAEELILDFGLDAHRRTADGGEPAVMLQRLVLTWSHAKRLALMLRDLVQMHEQNHGTIPLVNIQRPANPPPPSPT